MADVRAERAISDTLRDLSPSEEEIWKLDQKINERGVKIDMEAVQAAIDISDRFVEKGNIELSAITGGEVNKISEATRLLKWVRENSDLDIPDLTKGTIVDVLANQEMPDDIRQALLLRQKLGKTSVAKYKAIKGAICQDGRLRDLFMYHGSHTGRWTGKVFQPQNLPQNKFRKGKEGLEDFAGRVDEYFNILKMGDLDSFELCYPDVMETISYLIRPILIPSDGKSLFGGDYSSIEARVLSWLAEDEATLDKFREGQDLYKDLASTIYNIPIEEVTDEQRALGKQGILGLGYQMGAERFQETCKSYGMDVDLDLAEKVKNVYRARYNKVVGLWYGQEGAATKAVQTGEFVRCGKIGWKVVDDFLYCKLPSGRKLAFYKPVLKMVETSWGSKKNCITYMHVNPKTKRWEETSTYGGKIVENITQAVARDLLASAMVECENAGYEIVLHVHDEILSEKEDGTAEEFGNLMMRKPEWAKDIPVNVDAWEGKRYLK